MIATILEPEIETRLFDVLAKCIRQELEIYRNHPKRVEKKSDIVETFDPRDNKTCFMGKGFKANADIVDSELAIYRKKIGTVPHFVWGDCTLMEIWGGDHFEEHNEMVVDAFKYGMNLIDECPEIKVFVNPLFKNKRSKEFKISEAEQEYKQQMDLLLAKAMIYGVNEPKKKKKK